jgi:hypothetical protein
MKQRSMPDTKTDLAAPLGLQKLIDGLSPAVQAARRQLHLDVDAQASFELMHGHHDDHIAICSKSGGTWHQKLVTHEEAEFAVAAIAGAPDCYLSLNGFRNSHRRTIANVSALTAVWLDLDIYKVPALAKLPKLTAECLLEMAMACHPWLPTPSLICHSGRGFYFEWALVTPLPREKLAEWQAVMAALVDLFAPFGADPVAKAASQVLRIVGAINSRSGKTVTAIKTGQRVPFEPLQCAVLDAHWRHRQLTRMSAAPFAEPESASKRPPPSAKQRAQTIQPYTLALARLQDYQHLARLRGNPLLTDYRHRMLFCYAVSAAWYRTDRAGLTEELDGFAAEHFADATRYTAKRVRSVLDRLSEIPTRIGQDRRYRLTNPTIIAMLEITPDEQRQLKSIISQAERNRRREERRRAKGKIAGADYLAIAAQRREAVLQLKKQGQSAGLIAATLGLSKRHVNRIISAEQPDLLVA